MPCSSWNRELDTHATVPDDSNHAAPDRAAGSYQAGVVNIQYLDGHLQLQKLIPGVSWRVLKSPYHTVWWTPDGYSQYLGAAKFN